MADLPVQPQPKKSLLANPILRNAGLLFLAAVIAGGIVYWRTATTQVSIPDSLITAPQIDLSPTVPGVLREMYVNEGDYVPANAVVAEVGNELVKAQVSGLVIAVNNQIGTTFNPGQAVVSMIDPTQLRVVGQLDENKGLDRIVVGQAVHFTVDAFGSKVYQGVVDEVSPTSQASGVVFNISDERQTQIFDVKVRFDPTLYPELKNGMSARITVFTN